MGHYFYITPEEYDLAAANGIRPAMLDRRVREQGWNKERAMTTPPRKLTNRNQWRTVAEQNGIKYSTFMNRVLNLGWTEKAAATTPLETPEERREHAMRASETNRRYPAKYIQLAERNGIPYATFHRRVHVMRWDYERASTEPIWDRKKIGRFGVMTVRKRHGDIGGLIFRKRNH